MSEQNFIDAVQAGCKVCDIHLTCSYPACACKQIPIAVAAAVQSLQADHAAALAEKDAVIERLENAYKQAMWECRLWMNRDREHYTVRQWHGVIDRELRTAKGEQ